MIDIIIHQARYIPRLKKSYVTIEGVSELGCAFMKENMDLEPSVGVIAVIEEEHTPDMIEFFQTNDLELEIR